MRSAAGEPPLNWGDPSDWERLRAHVSREAYRKLEVGHVSDAGHIPGRVGFQTLQRVVREVQCFHFRFLPFEVHQYQPVASEWAQAPQGDW